MNLKLKLDRIYNDVYRTNEASSEDRKIIIAGFEDAVNEGIGKWLGKAAGSIASAPSKIGKAIRTSWDTISNKTKDLYNKGVEKGKEVVANVKDWFKRTGEDISKKIGEWGDRIKSRWASFTDWCKKTYYGIGLSLLGFWEATKDKAGEFASVISKFWSDMTEKIKNAYARTIEKMAELRKNASKWVKENWKSLKEWGSEKYEGAVEWLRTKYNAALEFILKAANASGKGLKKAISFIAAWTVIKPYTWIKDKIEKIPALYDSFKKWLEKQANEFKLGFEETAGRPWNRAKGYMIPLTFPDVNLSAIEDDEEEWEKSKQKYAAMDEPFALGDWSKLGMPKSTSTGKSIVGEILTLIDLISHDDEGNDAGKDISEIEMEIGDWIVQQAQKRSIYRDSRPYQEGLEAITARTGKDDVNYSDWSDKDKSEIGRRIVEVVDEIKLDPRFPLYDTNAERDAVERAAGSLANSEAVQKMKSYSKKDLVKELRNRGMSEMAAEMTADILIDSNKEETEEITLSSGKKITRTKKKSMALPEMEYERLTYLKTFEKFRYK